MTTYYVSTDGSDSNNGLGPDASAATNKPWLTLSKALVSGSPVVAGDIIYIAPGYYYSAGNITVLGSISSTGSPTQIIGDPTNVQGFKNGSGVRLAPGIPWLTSRTSGEGLDVPLASTNNFFNCQTNNPSGLQFSNIAVESNVTQQSIWNCSANAGSDNTFTDCYLIGFNIMSMTAGSAGTAGRNLIFRRNTLIAKQWISVASTTAAATADADLNILFEENWGFGAFFQSSFALSASGGNLAGGVYFYNNTMLNPIPTTSAALKISTTTPMRFGGNIIIGAGTIINMGTADQMIDDGYNRIYNLSANATYTNVTQAGTSVINVAPNLVVPTLVKWGLGMPRSDFLGWTDAAVTAQKFSAYGRTTPDFRGRTARPWGAGSSIGCWQAQDITKDTSGAITGGGSNSLKLTGAGEFSFYIPVDATGFTLSVTTKSTSYGGASYPQMIVMGNADIGVSSNTTATASSATEQVITTSTITPTAKGVLEVRLISRSSSTTSTTHFDIVAAA